MKGDDDVLAVSLRLRLFGNLDEVVADLGDAGKEGLVLLRHLEGVLLAEPGKKRGACRGEPDGANIVVTLSGYRLISGCRAVRAASPKCCTMIGCPVCSLLAAIAALGTGMPTKLEHISVDEKRGVVRVILTPAGPAPRGAGPGNSR